MLHARGSVEYPEERRRWFKTKSKLEFFSQDSFILERSMEGE